MGAPPGRRGAAYGSRHMVNKVNSVRSFLRSGLGAACILCSVASAHPRIENFLMERTIGLKPPPFPGGIRFRGTPFGHMALYIESAGRDDEKIIRQCEEGETGGLVLTVDKQLKDRFFTVFSREEFFYGPLDPDNLPSLVTRDDIAEVLAGFNRKYGRLYNVGPGVSGLGQDYGVLYIRGVWGLVYPTTREEERKIIEHWQEHRHDEFIPMTNNCVTTITDCMRSAGLDRRRYFIRGLACYNTWLYYLRKFVLAGPDARAPNGNYLRRDGTCVTRYEQLPSEAVCRSGRPFNVYTQKNLEYFVWLSPACPPRLPSEPPVSYRAYPAGVERPSSALPRSFLARTLAYYPSRLYEFARLWYQSFDGIWFLIAG